MDWLSARAVINHHGYLREELPCLQHLIDTVASSREARHPVLLELRQEFRLLRAALEGLMRHEETCLFPICCTVEQLCEPAETERQDLDDAIRVDVCEHEDVYRCLRRIRTLSQGFTPPAELGSSYWALLDGLTALEEELKLHLDAEHCLMFPREQATEASSPIETFQV
jgi:regulator of cell morphogenesis and NO signaling